MRLTIASVAFLVLLAVVWAALVAPGEARDANAAQVPPRPPELNVLQPLVGNWDNELISKPAEWTPKEQRLTSVGKTTWQLGERFLQVRGRSNDGKVESAQMITYDPQKKVYRQWYFDSDHNI